MSAPLGGAPREPVFMDDPPGRLFTTAWKGWISTVHSILYANSSSGTTAQRPNPGFVGQRYFDTTLGIPIFAKTLGAAPVWVNGAGAPV